MTVQISGAMIVRDAEKTVRAALNSLRPACDEVVLLDTGSQDGTIDVLRDVERAWDEDGEGPCLRVHERPWRQDFSDARNACADLCSGSWCVVLDADEIIEPGDLRQKALAAPDNIDGLIVTVVCEGDHGAVDRVRQVRCYRRDRARWKYPVHNQLLGVRRAATTVAIVRTSYRGDLQRRLDRSVPMLERYWTDHPRDVHAPLMLAHTYAAVERWEEALRWADAGIAVEGDEPRTARLHEIRAQALCQLRGLDAAEAALREGIAVHPDAPDLRYLAVTLAFARWGAVAKAAARDPRYALTALRPLPTTAADRQRMQAALDALDLGIEIFGRG